MKKSIILFAVAVLALSTTINAENGTESIFNESNGKTALWKNLIIQQQTPMDYYSVDGLIGRYPKYRGGRGGSSSKQSLGVELDYNFMRFGAGIKYGYNFTDLCRFVLQADYYIISNRPVNDINMGSMSTLFWGRQFDVSPSLNLVFGNGDFHFYLITGLSIGWGYNTLFNVFGAAGNELNGEVTDKNGNGEWDRDELIGNLSFGFRLGCGVEYQINDQFRIHLEQALDLVIPLSSTNWMMRLGGAYCF